MAGKTNLIILIEPDEAVRTALCSMLKQHEWTVDVIESATGLATTLGASTPRVVVSESSLRDTPAAEVLAACKAASVPIVFLGHRHEIQEAVDLMRKGAHDYLEKPFPQARLLSILEELRTEE